MSADLFGKPAFEHLRRGQVDARRAGDWYQSSARQDWETPHDLFAALHARFNFTVDGAAHEGNKKLPRYWSDAFAQSWAGERVWCNPPYGRFQLPFIHEAAKREAALSVLLIPVRTDTRIWQETILPRAEVWFLRGRLRFVGSKHGSTFASALVFFRPSDEAPRIRAGTWADLLSSSA